MWPFAKNQDPVKEALLKEYDGAKLAMYKPHGERFENGMFLTHAVVEICHNEQGRLGVIIARNFRNSCRAIHELNKDGTFSKKPVYWTSKRWPSFSPRLYALGLFFEKVDGLNPMHRLREQTNAIGYQILEMKTDKRPFMSFEDWRYFIKDG